jgi:hypothetical protein
MRSWTRSSVSINHVFPHVVGNFKLLEDCGSKTWGMRRAVRQTHLVFRIRGGELARRY